MLLDQAGFAIPACDLEYDELTEGGFNDPDYGDPADWPAWTDEERFEPTDEEWADFTMWSERRAIELDLPL